MTIFFPTQALQQIQALNGFTGQPTPGATLVNGVGSSPAVVAAAPAQPAGAQINQQVSAPGQLHQQPNPYQGAGLTSATTATAQPATAVNLLALQQLIASSNGTIQPHLALANGNAAG